MTPSLLACKNWLHHKLTGGESRLAVLQQAWAEQCDWKTGDSKHATVIMGMFIAAQQQLELVAESDGNGPWRLRKMTAEEKGVRKEKAAWRRDIGEKRAA